MDYPRQNYENCRKQTLHRDLQQKHINRNAEGKKKRDGIRAKLKDSKKQSQWKHIKKPV